MAGNRTASWTLLTGIAAGAAAYYFLDPKRGAERRDLFTKKAGRLAKDVGQAASKSLRDSQHRLSGLASHVWPGFHHRPPEDRVLEERIRSRMGRIVSDPHRIHVASDAGTVTLWGTAPDVEAKELVHAVETMDGVNEVLDHLEIHPVPPAENEPDSYHAIRKQTLLNWNPSKRLVVGALGTAAAVYGWKRKDNPGLILSLLGAGMAATSLLERNPYSMLALSQDSPGYELDRTITINAPLSDLYGFWTNPENYPKVFSHISNIERLGENLYRWTIVGPANIPIQWEGMITQTVPNTTVEWKSLPGSMVGNFGIARFDANYDASTRLRVRMFYRPPAGILGRFLAELFGADPEKVLDHDLKQLKRLFEQDENLVKELQEGGDEQLLKTATT
ncbi:MAG: BON domain-containing protein [Acidobacteriia bacterium]|nr:BON domain-containing protein [Terriglobia bacterium]